MKSNNLGLSRDEQRLIEQIASLYQKYFVDQNNKYLFYESTKQLIEDLGKLSIECQKQIVEIDGQLLGDLDTNNEQVIEQAIRNDHAAIVYVENKTLPLQLLAVKLNGEVIRYIDRPSPMIQWAAVKCFQSIGVIKYVIEPRGIKPEDLDSSLKQWWEEKLKTELMESNTGMSAKEQDLVAKIDAMYDLYQQNRIYPNFWTHAEGLIHENLPLSKECQLQLVSINGGLLEFFDTDDLDVEMAAVKNDPDALEFCLNKTIPVQLTAVQQNGYLITHIHSPSPMIQTAACKQNPDAINLIEPIEVTDINLLKKYRNDLDILAREYLEKIERQENLTESRLKSGEFTIEYWIPSPHQAKFELNQNTNLFDRERNKEGLVKRTATATIEAIQNQFECTLNNITKGTGPTITAAIYDTLPKAAKYLTWHRK